MQNDRWELIFGVEGGHRYFREKATGKVAVADDSGEWPEDCDGGPVFVDTGSPIYLDLGARFIVGVDAGSGVIVVGRAEAAAVIRNLGMMPQWPSLIRRAMEVRGAGTEAMRAALEAFVATIEATGGLYVDGEDELPYPAADHDWVDLGEAADLAYAALGRPTPVNYDGDACDECDACMKESDEGICPKCGHDHTGIGADDEDDEPDEEVADGPTAAGG